jgi:hypothetical protein
MVVPAGGSSGQVLAKASAADYDTAWVTDATGIPATLLDAKGDLIVASAADTAARLAVGTNGYVLAANSSTSTGVGWVDQAGKNTGSLLFPIGQAMSSTASNQAHALIAYWYLCYSPATLTVSSLSLNVTTLQSGSTARLGVYQALSSLSVGTLISDFGLIDSSTTGAKTASGSATVGGYFFVCAWFSDHSTVRFARANAVWSSFGASSMASVNLILGKRLTAVDYSAGLPASPSPTNFVGVQSPIILYESTAP